MRKILIILAVLVGFLLLLRACGEGDTGSSAETNAAAVTEPADQSQPEQAPASTVPDTTFARAPEEEPAQPAAATASFVSADIGNALSADMKIVTPMNSFGTKDTMSASIATTTSDPKQSVKAKVGIKVVYQTGQVLAEQARDIEYAGPAWTAFSLSRAEGWPAGDYTFEFFLDGKSVGTKTATVK
jgi:hypothetical protein